MTSPRRPFRPTDIGSLEFVSDLTVHTHEPSVVYVVSRPDLESDGNRSNLYAVGADGTDRRRLTEGYRDADPRFSPDGSRLAFIRTGPGEAGRVIVMEWPTGELTEVAQFEDGGPQHLRWAGHERLLVLAPQRPDGQIDVDDEELSRRPRIVKRLNYRFNGRGYINDRPTQIWSIPVSGERSRTTDGAADGQDEDDGYGPLAIGRTGVDHHGFAVSPDGDRIVAVTGCDDSDLTGNKELWIHPLGVGDGSAGNQAGRLLTDDSRGWTYPVWLPDGRIWVSGPRQQDNIGFDGFFEIDVDGASPPRPVAESDDNVSGWAMPGRCGAVVDGSILMHGMRRGRVTIDAINLTSGARRTLFTGDCQAQAFDAGGGTDPVTVAAITSPTRPAELWRIDDGQATKLVSLNDPVLDTLDLAELEAVTVTSADGAEVEGFVVRPPASAPDTGDRRPGLIYVHGGPMTQYGYGFFDEFQVAAACGYVVIGGNPRGSDGYGEAWAAAISGDYGNKDWLDVQALTEHLAGLDEVDADRIGIGGGSYGGFMTSWALGHDDDGRYRAGLVERAVTDWRSMYGTSDIGNWFSARNIASTIENDLEGVLRQSPLSYAADITVPTMILHSEEDWRCPIEQAEQLFSAIRRNGGDAVLVRFPGENHELSRSGQPRHRVERFEIVHEFFARHLGGADFDTAHLP